MSVAKFNGKVVLSGTGLADISTTPGSRLTWTARFSFADASGKWLGTDLSVGDVIALDTSGVDTATITTYIVTAISTKTFNTFNVTIDYSGSNRNPAGAPDISNCIGQPGYVGSKTLTRGLALLPDASVQQLPSSFGAQLLNDNVSNILDLASAADAINGGTAGAVLYQGATG